MNTKNDTKIELVIKDGSVIFPNYKTEKADRGISEGKICEIGSIDRSLANQVVDAKGLIVMPGANFDNSLSIWLRRSTDRSRFIR